MKILLAYISGASGQDDPYLNLLPTGLCSLQAFLREAGYDAVLANFSGWRNTDIEHCILKLKPDVTGISQWTHNRHVSLSLARTVRELAPSSVIVMGGGHATYCYHDILTQGSPVDCVVTGEGEETLLELVSHIGAGTSWHDCRGIVYCCNGDVVTMPARPPLSDLDRLPFSVQYLDDSIGVDFQRQPEFVLTSRGCPSACRFCSSPEFWGRKVRFRSPQRIVDEILHIRSRFGLIYFSLRDDTFTVDRSRTIEFCRLLIESRAQVLWNCQSRVSALDDEVLMWMKRAGCECIQPGVESGSERLLSVLGKTITARQVEVAAEKIRAVGIGLSVFLISDIPGETEDDVCQTINLIKKIRADDGYVSPLAYYPGTRLFEDAVHEGMTDRSIFAETADAAVFASGSKTRNSSRLVKQLTRYRRPGSVQQFKAQKSLLGYCFATNVLAGEWLRQTGEYAAAEREFNEIVERDSDNPWGWFLLAELYSESEKGTAAMECYRSVCSIVPGHKPSQDALSAGAKKKRGLYGPAG